MTKTQLEFCIFHLTNWIEQEPDENVKTHLQALRHVYALRLNEILEKMDYQTLRHALVDMDIKWLNKI